MNFAAGLLFVTVIIGAPPLATPEARATDTTTTRMTSASSGMPVEVEIDGTVVGVDLNGAPCGVVFDGALAEFRNANVPTPKIFYRGAPYVRRAKLVGKRCSLTIRTERAVR